MDAPLLVVGLLSVEHEQSLSPNRMCEAAAQIADLVKSDCSKIQDVDFSSAETRLIQTGFIRGVKKLYPFYYSLNPVTLRFEKTGFFGFAKRVFPLFVQAATARDFWKRTQ